MDQQYYIPCPRCGEDEIEVSISTDHGEIDTVKIITPCDHCGLDNRRSLTDKQVEVLNNSIDNAQEKAWVAREERRWDRDV